MILPVLPCKSCTVFLLFGVKECECVGRLQSRTRQMRVRLLAGNPFPWGRRTKKPCITLGDAGLGECLTGRNLELFEIFDAALDGGVGGEHLVEEVAEATAVERGMDDEEFSRCAVRDVQELAGDCADLWRREHDGNQSADLCVPHG